MARTTTGQATTYAALAYSPVGGLSPPGRKPYAVLNPRIHLIADKSRNVKKNMEAARDMIDNYDAPFWVPIDSAKAPGCFVDRLFTAVKNLSKHVVITPLWMRDALTLIIMVRKLDDKDIAALFAPYIAKLRRGVERGELHPEMIIYSKDEDDDDNE